VLARLRTTGLFFKTLGDMVAAILAALMGGTLIVIAGSVAFLHGSSSFIIFLVAVTAGAVSLLRFR
jgi:hypothetical protein